jgi:hypothetical protein
LRKIPHQDPKHPIFLGKVEYDAKIQDNFFDDLLSWTIRFFLNGVQKKRAPDTEKWMSEFLLCWSNYVIPFALLIKHPKFCGEREWRLLYPFNDEAIPRMRYLQRSSMMTKHVPLRLKMCGGKPRLPLQGVVVGPCRHRTISRLSVFDLLNTYGYPDAYVCASKIPYQTV